MLDRATSGYSSRYHWRSNNGDLDSSKYMFVNSRRCLPLDGNQRRALFISLGTFLS